MNVLHVVPGISEQASGTSVAVSALCEAVAAYPAEVSLHTLGPSHRPLAGVSVHDHRFSRYFARLRFSNALWDGLRVAAATTDIMHNHSLWMMPNVYPGYAIRGTRCRLVTSPHGTLSPWALRRSRFAKWLMWHVCQGRSIRDSACFHVTCDAERAEVRAAKLRGPIAVIPCGIDIPELTPLSRQSSGPRRVLFLGRVHPTKGVDTLIRAWRSVQHRASDWELQIAGPDNDGYLPKMRKLAMSLGAERISFAGPVYGQEKGKMYQQADVFVLPTHSENFGISVAEALSYGVPVIVTRGAPWAGIEQRRCGWWIENNQESLSDCLRQVTGMRSEDLFTWGGRGRVWMANDFSWRQVGRMMYETYLWILGGGTPPAWVTPAQRSSVRATLNPQQKA